MAQFDKNVVDSRILCPNTGEVCPARESVVELFDIHVSTETASAMPADEYNPWFDTTKLTARLREYDLRAQFVDCASVTDDTCPVRVQMNESAVRVGIVGALRRHLGRVR